MFNFGTAEAKTEQYPAGSTNPIILKWLLVVSCCFLMVVELIRVVKVWEFFDSEITWITAAYGVFWTSVIILIDVDVVPTVGDLAEGYQKSLFYYAPLLTFGCGRALLYSYYGLITLLKWSDPRNFYKFSWIVCGGILVAAMCWNLFNSFVGNASGSSSPKGDSPASVGKANKPAKAKKAKQADEDDAA